MCRLYEICGLVLSVDMHDETDTSCHLLEASDQWVLCRQSVYREANDGRQTSLFLSHALLKFPKGIGQLVEFMGLMGISILLPNNEINLKS